MQKTMMADPMRVIDPFYYLDNFRSMLETLKRRDGDLLTAEESSFIREFFRLPQPSSALLVRMVMRKGPLFRAARLVYPEIGDIEEAIRPLTGLQWVDARPALTVQDLFALYSKAEVAQHLGLPKHCHRVPKSTLLASLLDPALELPQLENWSETADTVFRLEVVEICERLRLMFFGNSRQDWTEFVLSDLGIFKFEQVCMHGQSRPFPTRRHVDGFLRLHRCREMLHSGDDLARIELAMPPHIPGCDWLEERREKLRFQIARAYERAGECDQASAIYSTCAFPEARIRASRIGAGCAARRRRQTAPVPSFELTIDRCAENAPVEYRVRDHLMDEAGEADEATSVHYVENGLINALFGLLCWPAVFAPVPGAFFHAFHHGPADLPSAGFVARRKREFAECLAELESDTYRRTILRRFSEKHGISSPFVTWGLIDEPLLRAALQCFPAAHLGLWFDWMVRDLRSNRSGFPDLVQFWPRSRRYRLIEVKAPGDRLQQSQRRCFEFLLSHQVPVSLCRVRWRATVA
jgi:VRR-NUC domain